MSGNKVWLITGCSSGIGRALAQQALLSGVKVVVTARNVADIQTFQKSFPDTALLMTMDITDPQQIKANIEEIKKKLGRIDVLVNNAGYGMLAAIEEAPDHEVRKLFETNFFGPLEVIRSVLPIMRAQKSGHIINISATGGVVATQCLGIFNASKFALEGMTEALAQEVSSLGIHVSLIEPGPSRTNFLSKSMKKFSAITDYDEPRNFVNSMVEQYKTKEPGDPQKMAKAIIEIVNNPAPPLRLALGKFSVERIREKISEQSESLTSWEQVSVDTDFK